MTSLKEWAEKMMRDRHTSWLLLGNLYTASPSLIGPMKTTTEIQCRIEKEWQDICDKFVFCHSPDIVLRLHLQGVMDKLLYEGDLDHWEIEDLQAELRVNNENTNYFLRASATVLWRKRGPLLAGDIDENTVAQEHVFTSEFANTNSTWAMHLQFGPPEGYYPQASDVKKLSRWELILNEEEDESTPDTQKYQQKDRANTG